MILKQFLPRMCCIPTTPFPVFAHQPITVSNGEPLE
jgi:hypothetical protein